MYNCVQFLHGALTNISPALFIKNSKIGEFKIGCPKSAGKELLKTNVGTKKTFGEFNVLDNKNGFRTSHKVLSDIFRKDNLLGRKFALYLNDLFKNCNFGFSYMPRSNNSSKDNYKEPETKVIKSILKDPEGKVNNCNIDFDKFFKELVLCGENVISFGQSYEYTKNDVTLKLSFLQETGDVKILDNKAILSKKDISDDLQFKTQTAVSLASGAILEMNNLTFASGYSQTFSTGNKSLTHLDSWEFSAGVKYKILQSSVSLEFFKSNRKIINTSFSDQDTAFFSSLVGSLNHKITNCMNIYLDTGYYIYGFTHQKQKNKGYAFGMGTEVSI